VACAADELKQVLVNILLNAIDACSAGSTIRVSTAAHSGPQATGGGLAPDPGVGPAPGDHGTGMAIMRVADDGVGIPAADLSRIFDPFFTTKAASGGSGMGLSISYAIVRRAGGDIRVTSAEGAGTEVEVMLPCT